MTRASLNIPLQNLEHNQAAGPSEPTTGPRLHACSQPSRRHGNRDRLHPHLVTISALVKEKKSGGERNLCVKAKKKDKYFLQCKAEKSRGLSYS